MNEMQQDDRFVLDARLAELVLGWRWWRDPQWNWVGIWPPDEPQWTRYNFPERAEPVDGAAGHQLMPSWNVGGFRVADGPQMMGVPRFASDWRAMALLIEQMRGRGFWWNGANYAAPDRPAYATFSTLTNSWAGQAETLPKASAVAALAAMTEAGTPGEVSDQTIEGRLTSIRNVARRSEDAIYSQWLLARGTGDTTTAALAFVAEWAGQALAMLRS